ncbi:hypothetical protein, partial [Salmonella sp. s51228]|uniref:hypothetical protein n=1 Tax=Salmonella sp. s51228 TaxID=3159652 RepID=UPI00397F6BFB
LTNATFFDSTETLTLLFADPPSSFSFSPNISCLSNGDAEVNISVADIPSKRTITIYTLHINDKLEDAKNVAIYSFIRIIELSDYSNTDFLNITLT